MGKVFGNHESDKGLGSRIYKETSLKWGMDE